MTLKYFVMHFKALPKGVASVSQHHRWLSGISLSLFLSRALSLFLMLLLSFSLFFFLCLSLVCFKICALCKLWELAVFEFCVFWVAQGACLGDWGTKQGFRQGVRERKWRRRTRGTRLPQHVSRDSGTSELQSPCIWERSWMMLDVGMMIISLRGTA